jgi:hypothetical protein
MKQVEVVMLKMSKVRMLGVVIGWLTLAGGTAAADRTMVVLLDATGSMQAVRGDGVIRYDQAKLDAANRVMFVAGQVGGLSQVAVYKFFGAGIVPVTAGFVSPFDAATAITASTVTVEVTPLASSMCDTVDIARASGSGATTTRFLEVYTDGDENATDPLHPCFGPASVSTTQPFDSGPPPSWQFLVYARTTNPLPAVTVDPTLYHDVSFAFAASARRTNPEAAQLAALGRFPAARAAVAVNAATDADFFSVLARDTGGTFTEVVDSAPAPVIADLDGDFDVDRNDAIALARRFGATAFPAFDLNDDGKVGFGDYAMLVARLGTGTGTPVTDPYAPSQTVNCTGGRTVTIDGKVIENGGITIQSNGACRVIIRNSLIVSGSASIKVRGATLLQIDNSIIVGEGPWLDSGGATTLSAARSVFHGKQQVVGALVYIDRGGNTFEK